MFYYEYFCVSFIIVLCVYQKRKRVEIRHWFRDLDWILQARYLIYLKNYRTFRDYACIKKSKKKLASIRYNKT